MDQDAEDLGELASEEQELADRAKISRIFRMESQALGLDSEASFERLMRSLDARRDRQRRWRLRLACFLGAATIIIALVAMLRLLHR